MEALKLNIYTNIACGWLEHALVYDLKTKKRGVKHNFFFNLRVSLPGGLKYFCEYLRENENIFENILAF